MRFGRAGLDDLIGVLAAQFGQVIELGGEAGQPLAERTQFGIQPVDRSFGQQCLYPFPPRPVGMRGKAKDLPAPRR